MKQISAILLTLFYSVFSLAIEKEVTSEITSATVFLSGAQVNRESSLNLTKGESILKFKELSPYIDKNSVKVKGIGDFTILSVNHQLNYIDKAVLSKETEELSNKIESLKLDIEYKSTELASLAERKDFLTTNKKVLSNDKATTAADFRQFKDIYSTDYESLNIAMLKKQREINELNKELKALNKQTQDIYNKKDMPTSEIVVTVSSKSESKVTLNLSYYVDNAGWYPSYDIRVDNINLPANLIYKANVYQNTGVDWKNVLLTFSNATPSESANIPVLIPYYLDYHTYRPATTNAWYDPNIREVSGIVRDEYGEPISFANIFVKDKSIGTTTDFDGKFSLAIPMGAKSIVVQYVGYNTKEVAIAGSYLDITLGEQNVMLDAVIINSQVAGVSSRSRGKYKEEDDKELFGYTAPVSMKIVESKTNFQFQIEVPYTLKSNSNNLTIEMQELKLNSSYVYKSIPKLNPQAFLIANIIDWESLSLLDGELNLYYENTFVGKSLLDLAQMSDTLEVSLGPDKSIVINRNKEKELASKNFIGSNKVESRIWKTSIRNNKSEKIKLFIYDQLPVSNNSEISVNVDNVSNGKMNNETGEVIWELVLEPKMTVEKTIAYSVKYPKKKNLRVE